MELENKLREVELRLHDYVNQQVIELVQISKQNMVTNSFKNNNIEIMRQDMVDVFKQVAKFGTELEKMNEFNTKLARVDEMVEKKLSKIRKDMLPFQNKANGNNDSIDKLKDKVRSLNLENKT